jgi:hypothetical protein
MSMFDTSRYYKLAVSEAGVISVAEQGEGLAQGLLNEVTGILDGGLTGAVGMAHTAADAAKIYAGMFVQRKLVGLPGLPLLNGLNG